MDKYRKDICTCSNGMECTACQQWRKKHKIRRPHKYHVPLTETLRVAEERLTVAISTQEKLKVKNYKAQIRMILGRIKIQAEMVAVCEAESDECRSCEDLVCMSISI